MSMRKVYRKVAKKHGISIAEVKKEIQAVISEAYINTPSDGITGAYQSRVPTREMFQRLMNSSDIAAIS